MALQNQVLGILIAVFVAMPAASSLAKEIEIHGHRGARARYPENTLPAFEYAMKIGVDVLELDLAVTKDNVLVVSHDPHIDPAICLGPGGKRLPEGREGPLIHSLSLAEVKRYDCGALKNPRFPDQENIPKTQIPTLDEVFQLVKTAKIPLAKTVRFNIETKIFPENPYYTVDPKTFAELVYKSLKKNGMLSRTIIQSFDPRTLVELKRIDAKVTRSLLVEDGKTNLVAAGKAVDATIISPYWKLLTKENVDAIHRAGMKVVPWTANTAEVWKKLVALGVDGIITDDPQPLKLFLKRRR